MNIHKCTFNISPPTSIFPCISIFLIFSYPHPIPHFSYFHIPTQEWMYEMFSGSDIWERYNDVMRAWIQGDTERAHRMCADEQYVYLAEFSASKIHALRIRV